MFYSHYDIFLLLGVIYPAFLLIIVCFWLLNKYKFKIKKTTITKWTFIGGAVFLIIINIIKLVWGIFFVSSIPSVPAPYWNAWRYEVVVPLQYCSLFPIVYLLSAFVDRKKIFYDFSIIFGLIASISFIVDPIMFMNESVAIVLGRASGTYTPFQYAYSLCCIMYHCGYVFITATLIVFQIKKISFKSIGWINLIFTTWIIFPFIVDMFVKLNPKYGDKLFLDFCTLSTLFHMLIPNALQSASHYLLTFLGLLFSALLVNVLSVAMIGLDQIFTMLTLRKSPKIHT